MERMVILIFNPQVSDYLANLIRVSDTSGISSIDIFMSTIEVLCFWWTEKNFHLRVSQILCHRIGFCMLLCVIVWNLTKSPCWVFFLELTIQEKKNMMETNTVFWFVEAKVAECKWMYDSWAGMIQDLAEINWQFLACIGTLKFRVPDRMLP